ncbi:MAG: tetrahydrofolate dehydrogenase/cyclohydrolase catalytic domain-containing protein [Collinsella sp.]
MCVLRERGVMPTLAIVRVGEREDDLSYERGALKRCEKVGIEARRVLLPADVSQDELLAAIEDINADPAVHGCLMFRPLPAGLDEDAVAAALDPAKDVDSMTPASLLPRFRVVARALLLARPRPCWRCWTITALSWMELRLPLLVARW